MLPVFGRPRQGPTRHAVIGTRGSRNNSIGSPSSGCYCIERDVRLLRDPDAMKQDCQLASDGDDGPIAGLLASARGQVQTPLS